MLWLSFYAVPMRLHRPLNDKPISPHGSSEKQEEDSAIKTEPDVETPAEEKQRKNFELHDVAAFHAVAVMKRREREKLVTNIGPFRRALCARRYLVI